MGRRMEIRVLVHDPGKEARDLIVAAEQCRRIPDPRQLRVGKTGMKRSVTDGMDRLLFPPAAALRHRVVPLGSPAERAGAEPAYRRARVGHLRFLPKIHARPYPRFRPIAEADLHARVLARGK